MDDQLRFALYAAHRAATGMYRPPIEAADPTASRRRPEADGLITCRRRPTTRRLSSRFPEEGAARRERGRVRRRREGRYRPGGSAFMGASGMSAPSVRWPPASACAMSSRRSGKGGAAPGAIRGRAQWTGGETGTVRVIIHSRMY